MFFSYDEHAHIMMPVRDVENLIWVKSNQQCMDSFICLLEVHVVCDDIKLLFWFNNYNYTWKKHCNTVFT